MRIDSDTGSRAKQLTGKLPTVPSSGSSEKKGTSATLSYRHGGELKAYTLWLNKVSQEHSLQGETHQGLLSNHFYPKSYSPGDYQLTGYHDGQGDLQELALFIRGHHEALIEHVGGFNTQNRSIAQNSSAFSLLMYLTIPSEGIACRGWVASFTITRMGVIERTPNFSFPFTVIYDTHSADFKRSAIRRPTPFTPQPKETA